uniref:Uncharacterized protein n=1 Tax=Trichobilharzia regenti TaxID=157069 RepID=A0AA85JVN7_TRIRE
MICRYDGVAEAHLGKVVTGAVMTVPVSFSDSQGQAGMNVLRIISEPTPAAVAYGIEKKDGGQRNVLNFGFGGGIFDITVLTIDDGILATKPTAVDILLRGSDFDSRK